MKSKVDLDKAVTESTLLKIIDRELRRVKCSCDCALRIWIREHSVLTRHALSDWDTSMFSLGVLTGSRSELFGHHTAALSFI